MKKDEPILGKLITKQVERDAVHVAIAPVVANCDLQPGQHIGLIGSNRAGLVEKPIGIVDPFLKVGPKAGETFYMCLYPRTIKSLRHNWSHPAFDDPSSVAASEKWLRAYAAKLNCYDSLEDAFKSLIDGLLTNELHAHGSNLWGVSSLDDADDLRYHAQVYLGKQINWDNFTFSCSC